MRSLLLPASRRTGKVDAAGAVVLLALSAALVFCAPLAMPGSYSWISNVISESAAQGVSGAWIARLGFLCFGVAVLWLAGSRRREWGRATLWMHRAFGLFMVGTAAFSHKPWLPDAQFDAFEDFLHSVTATGMGFAFSFGVFTRLLERKSGEWSRRVFDAVALSFATVMPLFGSLVPGSAGVVQRAMFVVAYFWYASEALTISATDKNT